LYGPLSSSDGITHGVASGSDISQKYAYAEKLLTYNLIAAVTYQVKIGFVDERCSMLPVGQED
jgi:hypothetical protein